MKLTDKLLVFYLLGLSLFRIDFAFGAGSIVLTPTLILSLALIIVSPTIVFSSKAKIHTNLTYYFVVLLSLLAWSLISLIPWYDILQIKRYILFSIVIISTIVFLILFYHCQNKIKVISSFSKLFLIVYFIFCAIDIFLYNNRGYEAQLRHYLPFYTVHFSHISYFLIRMKGPFIDSNIAGYFLIFLYLLHSYMNLSKVRRWIFVTLVFLTFSRSSIATLMIVLMMEFTFYYFLGPNKIKIPQKVKLKTVKYVATSLAAILFICIGIFSYTRLGERISHAVMVRFSAKEESASTHLSLIEHGFKVITESPVSVLKGHGFSSSFIFTQKYFPGNKYANFHSEYITLLAEIGMIGFLIFSLIYIIPAIALIFKKNSSRTVYFLFGLIAFALENVFYQQYMFHYYWIFLGMIWLLPFIPAEKLLQETTPDERA